MSMLCLVLWTLPSASGAYDSECSNGSSFQCPNCGGVEVEDCLDCTGYLSTDTVHVICFDRKLFQPINNDPEDFDDHYHYFWNDLVGMVVWLVCAGIATAFGVGGGGIYVPLGILLFQFWLIASQYFWSIGGLFLNARNRHPQTKIRSTPGVAETSTTTTTQRAIQEPLSEVHEQDYLDMGGIYYTRALINYDMALFLAPMEMAGAVLGVLIQKILPNWLYLLIASR